MLFLLCRFSWITCSVSVLSCSLRDLPKIKTGMHRKRAFFRGSLKYLLPEYRGTSLVRTLTSRWFSKGKGFQKWSGSIAGQGGGTGFSMSLSPMVVSLVATGTRILKAEAPDKAVTFLKPLNEKRVAEMAQIPHYVSQSKQWHARARRGGGALEILTLCLVTSIFFRYVKGLWNCSIWKWLKLPRGENHCKCILMEGAQSAGPKGCWLIG